MTATLRRMKIGSDALNEAVRHEMEIHENRVSEHIAYYGTVTHMRSIVAPRAIDENPGLSDAEKLGFRAEFQRGQWFGLGAELGGLLFSTLSRYAVGRSVCSGDVHGGFARRTCDCGRRRFARKWAAEIATLTLGCDYADV